MIITWQSNGRKDFCWLQFKAQPVLIGEGMAIGLEAVALLHSHQVAEKDECFLFLLSPELSSVLGYPKLRWVFLPQVI